VIFIEKSLAHYNVPGVSIAVIKDFKFEQAKGKGETSPSFCFSYTQNQVMRPFFRRP